MSHQSVQSLSYVQTLCDPIPCPSPTLRVYSNSFMSTESVMSSNHLILCHPLLLPSISPSIRGFSSESALCIRWPKYWSSSFSITPSNEYSGLLSFRMDLFSLLSKLVLWTLKCDFHIIWRGGWRPYLEECGILLPRPGIKPAPPALGEQSLNHWTARKSPHIIFMCYKL